jgi:hypothetical protein
VPSAEIVKRLTGSQDECFLLRFGPASVKASLGRFDDLGSASESGAKAEPEESGEGDTARPFIAEGCRTRPNTGSWEEVGAMGFEPQRLCRVTRRRQ